MDRLFRDLTGKHHALETASHGTFWWGDCSDWEDVRNTRVARVRGRASNRLMRRLGWVWFAGFGAWTVDGFVSAHYRAWPHAELAFMLALLFLFAGLFYRSQRR